MGRSLATKLLVASAGLCGCTTEDLIAFGRLAAPAGAPVATYSTMSGYVVNSAFRNYDNAGSGSSSYPGYSNDASALRPETQSISVGDCLPGATVCQ